MFLKLQKKRYFSKLNLCVLTVMFHFMPALAVVQTAWRSKNHSLGVADAAWSRSFDYYTSIRIVELRVGILSVAIKGWF